MAMEPCAGTIEAIIWLLLLIYDPLVGRGGVKNKLWISCNKDSKDGKGEKEGR